MFRRTKIRLQKWLKQEMCFQSWHGVSLVNSSAVITARYWDHGTIDQACSFTVNEVPFINQPNGSINPWSWLNRNVSEKHHLFNIYIYNMWINDPDPSNIEYTIIKTRYSTHLSTTFTYYFFFVLITHSGRVKMEAISQRTFWNAFSWKKMYDFCLKYHNSLFLGVQLLIFPPWFR